MQRSRLRSAIERGDLDQNILDVGLCVFYEHVEIAVLMKHACIQQLKLGVRSPALSVFLHQPAVREFRLRVFVKHPHIAVSRCGIQVEIALLYILAVVSLVAG